jgi:hypothetical protein
MGNRAKSIFYSVLFNKFHHRINPNALLFNRIFKFEVLRVPPIQIPTQNGGMKVLFNKFHHRINLVALLLGNLGSRNKTTYSKFINFEF